MNAKTILQVAITIGLLTLSACAAPDIKPFPEGHPADTRFREPAVERSMTLADPEPVETAPARSEHFDQNGHDMHENDQPEHNHDEMHP